MPSLRDSCHAVPDTPDVRLREDKSRPDSIFGLQVLHRRKSLSSLAMVANKVLHLAAINCNKMHASYGCIYEATGSLVTYFRYSGSRGKRKEASEAAGYIKRKAL